MISFELPNSVLQKSQFYSNTKDDKFFTFQSTYIYAFFLFSFTPCVYSEVQFIVTDGGDWLAIVGFIPP